MKLLSLKWISYFMVRRKRGQAVSTVVYQAMQDCCDSVAISLAVSNGDCYSSPPAEMHAEKQGFGGKIR
jgi:hypothetical protein